MLPNIYPATAGVLCDSCELLFQIAVRDDMTETPRRYVGAWIGRQAELLPTLQESLDPLTKKLERLIIIPDTFGLEAFVAAAWPRPAGRLRTVRRPQPAPHPWLGAARPSA